MPKTKTGKKKVESGESGVGSQAPPVEETPLTEEQAAKAAADAEAERIANEEKAAAEAAAKPEKVNSEEEAEAEVPTTAEELDTEAHEAALADAKKVEIVPGRFYELSKEGEKLVGYLTRVDGDTLVFERWLSGKSTGQLGRIPTESVTVREISREQCYELSFSV